jgi:nucleoside-diphosphate-sugar epimerase
MSNILVTGGAGYVGSILIPKLIKEDYYVRVLDLMIFGSGGLDSVKDKCEIVTGDIRNSKLVEKCLEGIDSVIHLAAISNDPCSDLNPQLTEQVNFGGTKNLVESSKKKGIKRFINISTSSVYGIKKELNVTENLLLEPLTIYSKTKARAEEIVIKSNDPNFVAVNIRPATVCGYSPRMRLDLTVNILTEQAINKGKITVFGGEQKRPNIHIEDITNYYIALLKAPEEKIAGETFNAGYENHTLMKIAELIKNTIGNVVIERTETNDLRSYHISSEKIATSLGLSPQRTIRDAVLDLKNAFNNGLIPNPSDSVYRNIAKMKELNIK